MLGLQFSIEVLRKLDIESLSLTYHKILLDSQIIRSIVFKLIAFYVRSVLQETSLFLTLYKTNFLFNRLGNIS